MGAKGSGKTVLMSTLKLALGRRLGFSAKKQRNA
jgi:hypothetical protein